MVDPVTVELIPPKVAPMLGKYLKISLTLLMALLIAVLMSGMLTFEKMLLLFFVE